MIEIIKAQCQFCHKPVVMKIDSAIADLDPESPYNVLRLLPLVACTHCADLRVRRRSITEGLRLCSFALSGGRKEEKVIEASDRLLKAYQRLVSDWLKLDTCMDWDQEILNNFLAKPYEIGSILNLIWRMGKQVKAQPTLV